MGDAYDGYDLLGITQRGMNNPEPNQYSSGWLKFTPMPTDSPFLGCPNGTEFGPPENSTGPYDLYDFTTCDCNLPEDTWNTPLPTPYLDPGNQTQRLYWLEFTESRNRRCYSSPYWTLTNDAGKTFNFLDYVGTWMLDQDLDRLRAAIGADKLNIYGISYGTAVTGSYAAVYPQNAGKMILNGNLGTTMDSGTRESLFNYGEAMSQCNTKLIDMCRRGIDGTDSDTFRNPEKENLCLAGGHDYPYEALTTLWSRLEAGELSAATESGANFVLTQSMIAYYERATTYDQSGDEWIWLIEDFVKLLSDDAEKSTTAVTTITRRNLQIYMVLLRLLHFCYDYPIG
ncbi:hypothetical protein TrLO_g13176 [Triparma laevis f. longispina]|uniref:AB hydrolase-1 domain-containing protein n=1 Tax=Triparma laevis f. longispina TaxID=1714387 RepID=A0A9W7CEP3_9STRA|nr:hypothetical protein TrLO_g13176 [Triparma laevis f. longispina]